MEYKYEKKNTPANDKEPPVVKIQHNRITFEKKKNELVQVLNNCALLKWQGFLKPEERSLGKPIGLLEQSQFQLLQTSWLQSKKKMWAMPPASPRTCETPVKQGRAGRLPLEPKYFFMTNINVMQIIK